MRIHVLCAIVLCLVGSSVFARQNQIKNIALIDTTGRESDVYGPLIELAKASGLAMKYMPLDMVLDGDLKSLKLASYDGAFFIFGSEFFGGLRYSPFVHKVLKLLETYGRLPNRLIGLIVPSLQADPRLNVIGAFAPLLQPLGINPPLGLLPVPSFDLSSKNNKQASLDLFFYVVNNFVASSLESRPLAYQTTLNLARAGHSFYSDTIEKLLQAPGTFLTVLPIKQDCSATIKATLPYGLYWYNQKRNNHLFITTNSLVTFSGISESFHLCPTDFDLRREMHAMMHQMMWELKHIIQRPALIENLVAHADEALIGNRPPLPQALAAVGNLFDDAASDVKKIAWMELPVFMDKTYDTTKQTPDEIEQDKVQRLVKQDLLVDYILKSGLDTLWISLTPNIFYSPIARCACKQKGKVGEQERQFLLSLGRFTKKLKAGALALKIALPRIMVGFEIANNLYAPNLPQLYAIDLYGNAYHDLPAPIDRDFWNNEIKLSLNHFLEKWKLPEISNGLSISGVVLDLEMYCRKKTGTFLTTMGFDGDAFKKFTTLTRVNPGQLSLHERVDFVMKNKQGKRYYQFLEKEAEGIGKEIAQHCCKKIPRCVMMCYSPNILVSWFYKGLCKGLNTFAKPLHLMTFNAEFATHQGWFKQQGLDVRHASVLLLSRLQSKADFPVVVKTLSHHHAIWLNRFSRMVEDKAKDWTSVEQPLMPERDYPAFVDYFARI